MRFPSPLVRGTLIQRYKRFLADVRLDDGRMITAACPNTGSMLGLTTPGSVIWLSRSDKPTRKYPFTWELIEADLGKGPALVGINTQHPNALVAEALAAGRLRALADYPVVRREVNVEIKNVHLSRRHGLAEFPDCETERGAKHLEELADMAADGHRAVLIFLIQRQEARRFALARDIAPRFAAAFDKGAAAGVEMMAVRCRLSPEAITVDRPVPIAGHGPAQATHS
jgi:sugar fermentation stimulation protein A